MDIYGHIRTYLNIYGHIQTFVTGFKVPQGGNSPRGGNSPELCDWWWPASGGLAPSEKTRLPILEHVSYGCCRFFIDFRVLGGSAVER